MARLELRFFGPPRLVLDDRPVKLERRKAEALLAFVVVEPREHRRSDLALLFWPEQSTSRGKAALRRTLCSLTNALGKDWLDIDRHRVALHHSQSLSCDVVRFERELSRARRHGHGISHACHDCAASLTRAVALVDGDFLSGLALRDAMAFDEWQHAQNERLRGLLADALRALVRFHAGRGAEDEALSLARRWLLLDPLDETSHETSMELYIEAGRRGAALRLYEAYAERLERELGIEPPASMTRLCRKLRGARDRDGAMRDGPRGTSGSRPRGLALRLASDGRDSVTVEPPPHRDPAEILSDGRLPGDGPASFDNVASAWRWACDQRAVVLIDGALDALHAYVDRKGLYREGIQLMDDALSAVDTSPVLGRLLARQAVLYACVGRLESARAQLEAALRIAREGENRLERAFCENRLGSVLFAQGSYARSRQLLHASVSSYRSADDVCGLSWALNVLGHLSIGTGRAESILRECLDRSRKAKDEQRVASALNSLGKAALERSDPTRARRALARSLELRRARHHRIGIADSLNNLGNAYLQLDEPDNARNAFEEAFDVARAIRARPLVVEVLIGLSHLHHGAGELDRAAELAAAALHLPGGWRDAKDHASAALAELSRELAPHTMARAIEAGKAFTD